MMMIKQLSLVLLASTSITVLACDDETLQFNRVTNPGVACVEPTADNRVAVEIKGTCITGSHIDLEANCDVTVNDDVIEVNALYEFETPEHVTLDCQNITTTCESQAQVEPGEYLLAYGDDLATVELLPPGDESKQLCSSEPVTRSHSVRDSATVMGE